jgi:signal peptidase I
MPTAEALALVHEGDFTLTGVGESMHPVYVPGTVVVVHPTSYFMLRSGDAVVYRNHAGRDVAHVLVERARAGWVAKGLNNSEPDDEVVTAENLVGLIRCAFVPDRSAAGSLAIADYPTKTIALLH